jgi:hypothetical protein
VGSWRLLLIRCLWRGNLRPVLLRPTGSRAKDAAVAAEDQARAVEDQTQLQRDLAKVAAEPRLWADIHGDDATGEVLVLLLGNSGPSIARNVKLMFDPPPPSQVDIKEALEILERGIASMAPGRTLEWVLGAAHSTVHWDANNEYKVRLEADGPFGPLEPLEYVIILIKGSRAVASGNLCAVALELHEIGRPQIG